MVAVNRSGQRTQVWIVGVEVVHALSFLGLSKSVLPVVDPLLPSGLFYPHVVIELAFVMNWRERLNTSLPGYRTTANPHSSDCGSHWDCQKCRASTPASLERRNQRPESLLWETPAGQQWCAKLVLATVRGLASKRWQRNALSILPSVAFELQVGFPDSTAESRGGW